jgi:tetratricopeptide (TPR) repeat protein
MARTVQWSAFFSPFSPVEIFNGHGFDSDALRLQSNSPDVLTLRGLVLFLCAQLPEAMKLAQVALRYDPDHEPAQCLHKRAKEVYRLKEEGKHAFNLEKLHKALRLYTEALEVCLCTTLISFCILNLIHPAGRRKRG